MHYRSLLPLFLAVVAASCGKDNTGEIPCTEEEYWDHVNEECVPRYRDSTTNNTANGDAGGDQGGDAPDMGGDEPDQDAPTNIFDPRCDQDNDGVQSIECGGMDCDDTTPLRSPDNLEFCDGLDNDCDDLLNEGLDCTFYAHSGQTLYLVDPFQKTVTERGADLPFLQDIDTHPNGALLGVTRDGLFQYDDLRDFWFEVGDFGNQGPGDPNGMAIDSAGRTFVTSEDQIYEIDILDGSASLLGNLGGDYYSSGDCVVNKRDSLYMTSKHDPDTDWLLLINRANGSATEVGPIGFTRVFALTAAWGTLYGLTDSGLLIEIDTMTGAGTLIHEFQGIRFFGAASTPSR